MLDIEQHISPYLNSFLGDGDPEPRRVTGISFGHDEALASHGQARI
jgi:hypothetical protein